MNVRQEHARGDAPAPREEWLAQEGERITEQDQAEAGKAFSRLLAHAKAAKDTAARAELAEELHAFNESHLSFTPNIFCDLPVDPVALLADLVRHGSGWDLDFSRATPEEEFAWGRADLTNRIVRALDERRLVIFLGKSYTDAGEIEDAIAESGRMVRIGCDDDTMLVVEAVGYEE